jgi:hypothetical protein
MIQEAEVHPCATFGASGIIAGKDGISTSGAHVTYDEPRQGIQRIHSMSSTGETSNPWGPWKRGTVLRESMRYDDSKGVPVKYSG